jgi:hypothetical protein
LNELLAVPWKEYAEQAARDAEQRIVQALEDRKLADTDGSEGAFKWDFKLRLNGIRASVALTSPPGFRQVSDQGFTFDAPRAGGWDFAISGHVRGSAAVKTGGTKIFSWSPGLFQFGLRIRNLRFVTEVRLDSSRPNRPTVVRAEIRPSLTLAGEGFLPVSIPISFQSEVKDGKIVLRGRMTGVDLRQALGQLDAKLTADLVISLLPHGILDLSVPEPEPVDIDFDEIPVGPDLRTLKIEFSGQLRVALENVGTVSVPFRGFDLAIPFPSPRGLDEVFTQISNDVPRRWGDDRRAPYADTLPEVTTLTAPVPEIEAAAVTHMPHGALLSFDYSAPKLAPIRSYAYVSGGPGGDEDSAIWTGHYLAAESFGHAKTKSPEALARVKAALEGLRRLFDVTTDAAGTIRGDERLRVPVEGGPGILSRTAKPTSDPIPYAIGTDRKKSGPLEERPCHYLKPEGGWRSGGRIFPTLGSIPSRAARPSAEPVGTIWYGWGCGENHPISRDQYVGTMMGLGLAWHLVPDPEVRQLAGKLIEDALDYLLQHRWNVRLPPDNRIQTTFLGDFPKQLAFLRIGKTVNPGKYGSKYDQVAAAAELAWIPVWFSSFDPIHQYYKFNLSHAAFLTTLVLEEDVARRRRWYDSYLRLWGPVAHHRNAYFDLVRILAEPPTTRPDILRSPSQSNPSVTLAHEVLLVLGEWVRRWTLVKGPHGGPLLKVGDASHQLQLWPDDFGKFEDLEGNIRCLAKYALPVDGRPGGDKDFMWQRDPFRISVRAEGCRRSPPPDVEDLLNLDSRRARRETPGVDYLLAYWLAVYLDMLPAPQ